MSIWIHCPSCKHAGNASDEFAGKTICCPECGHEFESVPIKKLRSSGSSVLLTILICLGLVIAADLAAIHGVRQCASSAFNTVGASAGQTGSEARKPDGKPSAKNGE